MKPPLAWKSVFHNKKRAFVAISGVSFAITIIFLQLGFHGAVYNTANLVFDKMDFDLALVSSNYLWIGRDETFPRERLYQALSVPGIKTAVPVYARYSDWTNAETKEKRGLLVLAFNTRDEPFILPGLYSQLPAMLRPRCVLMDTLSLPSFGPKDKGVVTEINFKRIQIAGHFTLGVGFIADGAIMVSDQNYIRVFEDSHLAQVNYGLVKLADGASLRQVRAHLRHVLPKDVLVLTRREIGKVEFKFWNEVTATGTVFGIGALVAFIVGMVVLYQILSTDIANNLSQYATLKAMGYADTYLSWVVLQQGLILAVMGYIPSYTACLWLYGFVGGATNLPITMTVTRAIFVFVLTGAMCAVSGLLSLRKVRHADPADLF